MRPEEKEELLSRVGLFEALPRDRVRRLGLVLPVVRFRGGWLVHVPGHRSEILYLLLRGRVRVYRALGREEATLYVVRAGDLFGEEVLAEPRGRHESFAQAVEDSEVALMRVSVFERFVREEPRLGLKMVALLSERLSFYADRVVDFGFKDVIGRLANLILHLAEGEGVVTHRGYRLPTRYTHQQLGTMIGAKRVAVTRAMGELREAGTIAMEHGRLLVKDPEALRRAAGR